MSESVRTNTSIWSKGMLSVIVAQFLSAFGDNALLFATLALLKAQFYRTGASLFCKWCLWALTFFCAVCRPDSGQLCQRPGDDGRQWS